MLVNGVLLQLTTRYKPNFRGPIRLMPTLVRVADRTDTGDPHTSRAEGGVRAVTP
jgi:hypothetical protein